MVVTIYGAMPVEQEGKTFIWVDIGSIMTVSHYLQQDGTVSTDTQDRMEFPDAAAALRYIAEKRWPLQQPPRS